MTDKPQDWAKEPWSHSKEGYIVDANGDAIGSFADEQRSIACVNACAGVPTEALEKLGKLALMPILEVKLLNNDKVCPKCGKSHYEIGPTRRTAMFFPQVIKDGVNINPDRNESTISYRCCECNHEWVEVTGGRHAP